MMCGASFRMSSPPIVIEPRVTRPFSSGRKLEIAFSVVVLPAPLAPSSATMLPSGTREAQVRQSLDDALVYDFQILDRRARLAIVS